MFISTAEKEKILTMIKALEVRVIELEGRPISEKPKVSRPMTQKHKDAIRAALKKRHAKAKAEMVGGTA